MQHPLEKSGEVRIEMDAALLLVVERESLKLLELSRREVVLGGKSYFDDEEFYSFQGHRIFTESFLSDAILRKLPFDAADKERFVILLMEDSELYDLYYNEGSRGQFELIRELLEASSSWGLVYLEEWEFYDELIECDLERAMQSLSLIFKQDCSGRGVIAYSDNCYKGD